MTVGHTVDGSEILHQLRSVVYPIIYRVFYIPDGAAFLPSTVGYEKKPHEQCNQRKLQETQMFLLKKKVCDDTNILTMVCKKPPSTAVL